MKNSLLLRGIFATLPIFAGVTVFGQNSKTPLDKGFIDKTIAYYYGRQVKLHPADHLFLIEKDSFNMKAKTDYGAFKVQFVTKDEAAAKIGPVKKKGRIDRICVKWVSLDTIDVTVTRCTMDVKKVSKVVNGQRTTTTENSITDCSSTNEEIPICRFVYHQPTSAWTQLDEGKLVKKN